METGKAYLLSNAARIAAGAAERFGGETYAEPLAALVTDLGGKLFSGRPVDIAPLRILGADDKLILRLLWSLSTQLIEGWRAALTPGAFEKSVLALRQCMRKTAPRLPVVGRAREFHLDFLDGAGSSVESGQGRLWRLLEGVMQTACCMVFVHDARGNIFYMNEYGFVLTGFSREDFLDGISLYDFMTPEYLPVFESRMGSPHGDVSSPFTVDIYATNGDRIPVEIATSPIFVEGTPVSYVAVARDVRREQRLQEEVGRANVRVEGILSACPIGVLVTDAQGVIQEANEAAAMLCGAHAASALIRLPLDAIAQPEDAALHQALETAAHEGRDLRRHYTVHTRFASDLDCDLMTTPLQGPSGRVDGFVVVMRDRGGAESAPERPRMSDRLSALREVVAGVARELNNPLAGILGYAQLLASDVQSPGGHKRLEHILFEAQRCHKIITDLSSFAVTHPHEETLEDINSLVLRTFTLFEYSFRGNNIATSLELAPGLPMTYADAPELQRVFLYILSNVGQSLERVNDRKRRLVIRTLLKDNAVHVAFEDNGVGIPNEIRGKVFEPFFTTKGVGDGIGLGLSVAYGIVQGHGGEILVDSTEGKGATFTVVLPLGTQRQRNC